MTKRLRRYTVVGVLLLAVAVALVLALGLCNPAEPVYEGKSLSLWLDDYYKFTYVSGTQDNPVARKKAQEAIRQIGTNGLPTVLRMIKARKPSPVVLKLLELAGSRSLYRILYNRSASHSHDEADLAFQVLGTNAACAVPDLIRICTQPRYPASQEYAVRALGHIGPAAKAAIPMLLDDFAHTNGDVRCAAVSAVVGIQGDPNIVVPALQGMLKDPNRNVRLSAASGLRNAHSAIPGLVVALHDPDPDVREEVENTLWNLAPEKVAKALIVEDATPMVSNGVTTEALSREANGELWTLIPKDTGVRRTVYQSVTTPPPLCLYRGLSKTTTNDHFLGRFEAIVPSPATDLSFEVVYIIDHQQILLCARDYNRKQFVELRRVETEAAK